MTKEQKIKNAIILLKATLGTTSSRNADEIVSVVIEILKEVDDE